MQLIDRIIHHYPRMLHALGRPLPLGGRNFRVGGYYPDKLARDFSDEPHSLEVIRRTLLAHEGAFLDVGANSGQTLIKVLSVDPGRAYFGFEPQISCCFYIHQFIRLNNLHSAKIIPVALSDANGMCELFSESEGSLTASVMPEDAAADDRALLRSWVPARRGDDLVEDLEVGKIALIKIDVEGFELEVLRGLAGTIARQHPVVMFEILRNFIWDEPIGDAALRQWRQTRADGIMNLLTDQGYAIFSVDKFGEEHRVHAIDLDERPDRSRVNDGRDYVARC